MKRTGMITIAIAVLMGVGWGVFRIFPRNVSLSLRGVEYQLGSKRYGVKPVVLRLSGTLHTSLWGVKTFSGTLSIAGATVQNKDNGRHLDIGFSSGLGSISYLNRNPFTYYYYTYGTIFTNQGFNTFTITVYPHNGWGWNSTNGLMISAPAQTRTQALQISNTLTKKFFDYPL